MAASSLPPGHPFTNVRPGYTGYESAPSPAIVSATASYVGAVGDYANSTITFQAFSTSPGDWTVVTPSGLTVVTSPSPNNLAPTTIVYTGGQRGQTYTFTSITQRPTTAATDISWAGTAPSVTLTVPTFGTTIASGYYDGNAIYLTPVTVTPLIPLVQGITGYFFTCTNNASYAPVDSTGMATIPYPSGTVFAPGTSTALNFTAACRFQGILGPASSAFSLAVIRPATPILTVTSATTSITISWAVSTPNCTFTISTGGTTFVPSTNPVTVTRSPGTYSFQVAATLSGFTTYSSVASTSVAPSPPTLFTATDNLNNSVTLSWASATAGAQFNLTWTGAATGTSNNIGNPPFTLPLGCGTYAFTLVSLCGGVTSGSVGVNNANVTPTTPTNFQQSVYGSTATLSWSVVTPGCQFTLTPSPTIVGVTPVITGNVAVYSGVPAGTYTITLQSLSGGLTSVNSVSTTFVVSLAAPTGFSARSLGSKITLNWAESTAGASFTLSCTNNSAFGTQTIPAGTFTTSYGNVSTPGIYTFSIVSVLPGNNVSAPVTVSGQIVSTPADFKAVSTGSTINLSWTQATTGSTFSLVSSPAVPNLSITGNTATSTGVTAGVYTFNLSAFTSGGSFVSTTISARTQVISTPTAFSAAFVAPNVTLSWAEATPNCTFTLTSSPALTNPNPTTALIAQYSSPLPGNYTFFVTAADGSGNTSSSASTSQTVTPPSPSNLAYTPVSPTAFTITFSEALANCTFGFTNGPTVGSVAVTGTAGSFSAAFTGVTPASAKSFTITVNSSYGGILSTGNSSIVARTKPNTTFSSNALCTVVGGFNTVSAQYIINNPDGVALYGPGITPVGTSYTVNMLYSGTTTTPGVSASSPNQAGVYYTNWNDAGGYGIAVPSQFPDFILPPTIGIVTASGTTITVPWTDSTTGSLTYAILNSTLSATGIAAGTQTRSFTNAVVGTAYSFTITTVSGYVTANSATSTAITPISTPTNLSAVATGTTVNMSWSYGSLTGITFNVLDQNGNTRGTTGLSATNTSFTVSDSTAYTFTVKAIAQGGNATALSSGISVTTVPVPSITSTLHNGSVITITCGTPASGTLSIAQTSGTTLTAGNTTNPFTYTGAAANTAYGFTVTNTGTRSTNTATSTITTMGQSTFTKSDASGQSVILQWSYPTGAPTVTSYSVFPSGSTTAVVTGLTSLSYTFVPSSGTPPFVYNVVAIGGVGTGIASANTDNITPLTPVTIGNPGATSTDGTNVTVAWTYPTTSTAGVTFKVYDPTLTTLYSSYSYSAVSSTYSAVFSTGLTRNSTYSFVVMTTNLQGDTAVSGVTSSVTLLTAPVVKTVTQTGGQILVTLSAQPAITPAPYTPYYTIPLISPASLTLTASTATTLTYSGASSATTYTFTVQNNAGSGAPNSTNTATQSFTTLSTPVPGSITYIPASTSVSASWTYGGTVAGTQFILKNADGSQFGTVTGVTSVNISATIGTTYTLTVTASSGGNVSFPSTAFSAVTAAIPFTISSFAQNGTRLVATVSGSASSASTVPSLGVPAVSGTAAFLGSPILWLDGADPAGNSTFPGTVTTWVDKSGLGNNATSQSGSIIVTGSGLSFDGSSKYLTIPGIAGTLSGTPFVVFAVETYTGGSSSNTFYFGDDANIQVTDSVLNIGYRKGVSAGGTGAYTFGFWNNDLNDTNVNITTTGVTRIWTNYLPGSSSRTIRRNGAVDATYTTANQLKAFTTPVIGRAFTGNYYTGIISEILVYRTDIGLPAIQTIEYYLSQKWGVPGPATVPYGYTGSPITFTFKGASANTNYLVNILGSGLTVSAALTTLYTPGAPTLTATTGTSVYASSTYNGVTNPAGITLNYYNSVGNTNLGSSFVATASQSYTLYATATSGLNTSISSANSTAIIPIGPITYTKVSTTGGGVAITCTAAGATSFSGTSPGLSATVNANVITFANPPLSGLYYIITIVATNTTGASNSITITEKTSFAPGSIPGLSIWYDAADIPTIGYRSVTTPTVANLQFWLDFADSTNLSAPGGNLTQINDKSGNNYTATAGSTVDYNATTKLLNIHNGQYLNIPQGSINAAPVWSMFMVIKPVNLTNSFIIAKQRDGGNSPTVFGIGCYSGYWGFPANTTAGMFTFKSTNLTNPDHLEAAVITTSLQILSMTYDGANFKFYVNGSLCNTVAGSWPVINETGANNFMLGSWYGNGQFYGNQSDFYLGELQFYSSNLVDADRQKVEGYLAWKWALQTYLPSTHTYRPALVTTGPAFTSTYSTTEVASWRDKSGNSRDLTYPGGSYPTYSATGFNGQYPGVKFNANSYLQTANILPIPVLSSNGTDTTVFVVYNDLNTSYYGVFGLDTDVQYTLLSPWSGNQHYFGFGGSWVFNNITFTPNSLGPQLYTITKLGSNSSWYNLGGRVTNGTSSTAATLTSTSQKFNVGCRTPGSYDHNSFISELLIYNYALNTTQRQQIEGYLAWKWGLQNALSTDNPYNGAGGVKPPSYVGPLSSGPIEWIDGTDTNTITFTLSPSALLLPLNIPQISMWFDAYDSTQVTLQSGTTNVTGWKDKSGNGWNATGLGGIGNPQYSATGFNGGYPGILFNGNLLSIPSLASTALTSNSTDTTLFIVFSDPNAAANNCILNWGSATQYRLLQWNKDTHYFNLGTDLGGGASPTTTAVTPGPQLFSIAKLGSATSWFNFGSNFASSSTVGTFTAGTSNFNIGGGYNDSVVHYWYSYISELIIYNYALNPTQRQQVEGYLAWKWGLETSLPPSHLGSVSPPALYTGPLSSGPIMWYDAADSSTMTFEISDVSGLVFLPSTLPQLQLWFDAYDAITVTTTDGTTVTGWKDKSGNGRNATGLGGSGNPQYSSNGFNNGKPGILFNGNMLSIPSLASTALTSNSTDTTLFVVFNDPNATANNCILNWGSQTQYRLLQWNKDTHYFNLGTDAGGGASPTTEAVTAGPQLFSITKLGSNTSWFNFGNNFAISSSAGTFTAGTSNFNIGGGYNDSIVRYWYSYISELIIYNYALNPTQRQQVEGYLAWTWGLQSKLPAGHLALTSPPQAYYGALSAGPIMWYDATDSSTMTFEISDVSGLVFLPSTLPQLQLWFDSYDADTVITTDGTTVTGWEDKSGNGRNATGLGGSGNPQYSSNGFNNGKPGILFNGNLLSIPSLASTALTSNSTDTTLFIVFNDPNAVANNCILNWGSQTQYRLLQWSTNTHYFNLGTDAGGGASPTTTAVTPGPQLFSITKLGSNTSWFNFGNNFAISSSAGTFTAGTSNFNIGGGYNDSIVRYWYSYISELIIYNYALNPTQRQQVEGYLAWTWGLQSKLPPGHLALTSPPQAYYGALSAGPIMWYDATDSSTMTFEISDVSGLTLPSTVAGLSLWFDSYDADTVITTDGVTVTGWEDKSGNGRNATGLGGSGNPQYSSNGFNNGKPGILFNGNMLSIPSLASTALTSNSTDTTLFVVFNDPNAAANNCILNWGSQTQYRLLQWNKDTHYFNLGTDLGGGASPTTEAVTAGPQLFSIAKLGSATSWFNFGSNFASSSTVGTFTAGTSNFNIGGGYTDPGTHYWYSYISELIIYNRALTTTERQQVEGYLAWTWGLQSKLPPGHPGLTNPPFPFTSPLSVGAIAWYDASDATTVQLPAVSIPLPQVWFDGKDPAGNGTIPANGASVTTWVNKGSGGSMYNAVQASGYSAATYSTACNALNFTTTTTAYSTGYPANPTAETMFVVANNPSPNGNNNVVIGGGFGARALGWGYAPQGSISYLNNQRNWLATAPGGYTSGTTALITGQVNGTNLSITQNGGLTPGTSATGAGLVAGTTTFLGADTGNKGTYYYTGYEMEILFYNSVLTVSQYQQVEGYLAWKWGIQVNLPPTHPYKTTAPSWTPASVGGGGGIQRWNDKSGRGYNLSLGSGIVTYGNTTLGLSINLSGGYMFSTSLANLQNYALFTVVASPQAVYNQAVITGRPNATTSYGSTDGFGLYVDSSGTPQLRLYGNSGGSNVNTVSGTGMSPTAMSPVIASYTGAANGVISSWINGSAGTIATTGLNRTTSGQGFAIGAEWTGSAYTNFTSVTNVYEIVVMSNVPSTIQRQQMEGYLAWKWGLQANLPASHPYKNATPIGPIPSYTTTNIMNVADKSGYNNTLTSNSISYPTYVSSAKGIYFGPNAALSNNFAKIPAGYTIIAVASLSSVPSGYGRLVNVGLSDFTGYLGVDTGSSNFATLAGNGTSWSSGSGAISNTPVTGVPTYPTMSLLEMNVFGSTLTPYFNGSGMNTKAGTTVATQGLQLGGLGNIQNWTGYLHEFLLVSQQLQPLQRQQLEGYLAWKWNLSSQLPTGHMFKNISPIQPTISSAIQPSFTTSNVMNWKDKSGYENFLTSNSISYPTYISSAKAIYFGPNASFSNPFVKIPAGYTMIAVASLSYNPTTSNQLVNIGPTNAYAYMGTFSSTTNFTTFTGNGTSWNAGTTSANTPSSIVPSYPSLALMEMNVFGTTLTPYFNGSAMVTKTGTTAAAQGIQIGGFGDLYNWTGYIYEFLLVSQQLQPLQRQQLEGYLAWKWNISSQLPTGHLFKNASPIQATTSSQIVPSFRTTNVMNWADKSGYGNFLTSNSISYPTYVSSAKGVYFGPNAALSNPFVKIPAGYSAFAIASLSSTPPDYGRLVNIGTTDYNGYIGTYSNSSNYQTFIGTGSAWNAPYPSAPSPAVAVATYPQLSMLELTFSGGTTYTPYVNGTNLSGISSTSAQSSVTGINFGQLPPGSTQPWTGHLHEFLLVSQLLTSGQRQQMEGYLAWKWNLSSQLPTGHPFRSSSPTQGYIPSSNVKTLNDKSGFGNNFSLASPITNYPQYSSLYKGVYIGDSASFVNTTLSVPTGYTMMAVASLSTTPGSYGRLINVGQGDGVGFLGTFNQTISFATFTGNGGWNDITANTPATPVSTNPVLPSIMEMTVCGTVLNPFFNASGMTVKTGTTVAATGMIIGATANNGGQFWPGYLNEFLLIPRTLTILQRQQLEGYLAWKWGLQGNLPSTHPFKNAAP